MGNMPEDFNAVKRLALNDGRVVMLDDSDGITITMIGCSNETLSAFSMPYPRYGYSEGCLIMADSQRQLLFYYYSGQGEEEWKLFEISDTDLVLTYESGVLEGKYAEFCFFDDDDRLLICMLHDEFECWPDGEEEVLEYYGKDEITVDESGNHIIDCAIFQILDIREKKLSTHRAKLCYSTDCYRREYDLYKNPQVNGNILKVSMPWSEESLSLPLDDSIVFKYETV